MQDIKTNIKKFRVDAETLNQMQLVAEKHFNGNLSAFIRCATLSYKSESQTKVTVNPRVTALLTSVNRQLSKIGTNVNQITRQINEKMKGNPRKLSAADLSPFIEFLENLQNIKDLFGEIKEILKRTE